VARRQHHERTQLGEQGCEWPSHANDDPAPVGRLDTFDSLKLGSNRRADGRVEQLLEREADALGAERLAVVKRRLVR